MSYSGRFSQKWGELGFDQVFLYCISGPSSAIEQEAAVGQDRGDVLMDERGMKSEKDGSK